MPDEPPGQEGGEAEDGEDGVSLDHSSVSLTYQVCALLSGPGRRALAGFYHVSSSARGERWCHTIVDGMVKHPCARCERPLRIRLPPPNPPPPPPDLLQASVRLHHATQHAEDGVLHWQGVTQDGGLLLNFKHAVLPSKGEKTAESHSLRKLRQSESQGRRCTPAAPAGTGNVSAASSQAICRAGCPAGCWLQLCKQAAVQREDLWNCSQSLLQLSEACMRRLDGDKAARQLNELTLHGREAPKHQAPQLTSRPSVPKLTIVLMATGTRGDVQPFMVGLPLSCHQSLHKARKA